MASNIFQPPAQGGAPPAPPADLPSLDTDEGPMRSELRRQIAALERELAAVVAQSCPWEPRQANVSRGPAVQSSANLEQIRDELLRSLSDLCRRIESVIDGTATAQPAPAPAADDGGRRGWRRLKRR
jgi:hypothetical protein